MPNQALCRQRSTRAAAAAAPSTRSLTGCTCWYRRRLREESGWVGRAMPSSVASACEGAARVGLCTVATGRILIWNSARGSRAWVSRAAVGDCSTRHVRRPPHRSSGRGESLPSPGILPRTPPVQVCQRRPDSPDSDTSSRARLAQRRSSARPSGSVPPSTSHSARRLGKHWWPTRRACGAAGVRVAPFTRCCCERSRAARSCCIDSRFRLTAQPPSKCTPMCGRQADRG